MGTWLREARDLAVHWIFEIKRLMSLRQQAKILGIAPSYLSMMVSAKRPWNPDVRERYKQLVNTNNIVINKIFFYLFVNNY